LALLWHKNIKIISQLFIRKKIIKKNKSLQIWHYFIGLDYATIIDSDSTLPEANGLDTCFAFHEEIHAFGLISVGGDKRKQHPARMKK